MSIMLTKKVNKQGVYKIEKNNEIFEKVRRFLILYKYP